MRGQLLILFAAAVAVRLSIAEDVQITLVDSPDGKYLLPRGDGANAEQLIDLSAVVTTLLNLAPLVPVDEATSQQVNSADSTQASVDSSQASGCMQDTDGKKAFRPIMPTASLYPPYTNAYYFSV